jgi:hypothetical protein
MTLATTADFETITGKTLDEAATVRVTRLLELASAAVVASAHGQDIVQATTTETVVAHEGVFYLSQRPATAVTAVVINGVTLDPSDYKLEPGGNGFPARLIRRANGADAWWGVGYPNDEFPGRYQYGTGSAVEATVTYTHGWDPAPGQLVAAVVAMANGVMEGSVGGQEVKDHRLGSFSESFTEAQSPDFAVSPRLQKIIDRLCKLRAGVNVPVST